jgi:hypothetical protein
MPIVKDFADNEIYVSHISYKLQNMATKIKDAKQKRMGHNYLGSGTTDA